MEDTYTITVSRLRRRYWLQATGFIFLVYSTLYIARPVMDFLKETIAFEQAVMAFLCAAIAGGLYGAWRRYRPRQFFVYVMWALGVGGYFIGFSYCQAVEEKIHFIEYSFLSFLLYRALAIDFGFWKALSIAGMLCVLAGWGDEGIQYLLPNRYYDVHDILFNALGGIVGLWFILSVHLERRFPPFVKS